VSTVSLTAAYLESPASVRVRDSRATAQTRSGGTGILISRSANQFDRCGGIDVMQGNRPQILRIFGIEKTARVGQRGR
jgi:hypothetical protein